MAPPAPGASMEPPAPGASMEPPDPGASMAPPDPGASMATRAHQWRPGRINGAARPGRINGAARPERINGAARPGRNCPRQDSMETIHKYHPHPAHPSPLDIGNRPTVLLVTVCTVRRAKILANHQAHQALVNTWHQLDHWLIGYYLIMPDHIHLFCSPKNWNPQPIQQWCGYWKRLVGKAYQPLFQAFQKDCWDTQMRNGEHYERKLEYVANNPTRKNLVASVNDWPYQGNLNPLPWISSN